MELEETLYWLELPEDAKMIPAPRLAALKDETGQFSAIFVTLIKQAKRDRTPIHTIEGTGTT